MQKFTLKVETKVMPLWRQCNTDRTYCPLPTVHSSLSNFTFIGAMCHHCGAKNPKIGPRVKTIPEGMHFAHHAGKN